jgi:hypothetical protein
MEIRVLNSVGIRQFCEHLDHIRAGEIVFVPACLLSDPATSEPLAGKMEVEQVKL